MKIKIFLLLQCIYLNAQEIYTFGIPLSSKPSKYSYIKDTEKKLDPYTGIWKYDFNEKSILIEVKKEDKVLDREDLIYRDFLVIRYEIKDKNGKIIESTLGKTFNNRRFKIQMRVFNYEVNKLMGIFFGGVCGLGRGFVYLGEPKNNQMTWTYFSDTILITDDMIDKCKGEVNLPQGEDLIFTKIE